MRNSLPMNTDMIEITDDAEIKTLLLGILLAVDDFCKKNGIFYHLASGTCLGAVRHGGFIPWDDDIDIRMPRPDYDKFITLTGGRVAPGYTVLCTEYNRAHMYPFAKVCDERTFCKETRSKTITENGLSIDVFPVDGTPADYDEYEREHREIRFWRRWNMYAGTGIYFSDNPLFTLPRLCMVGLAKLTGCAFFIRKITRIATRHEYATSEYVGLTVWGYGSGRERIQKKYVDKTIPLRFEGYEFPVPAGYDEYLKTMYGDYRALPPADKQVARHDYRVYWRKGTA